jgi:tyrosyl-tRNA synthetase
MYAAHFLPRMGYAKRAHLMNPKSKIDFLDSPAEVKAKLKAAVCTPGQVEGNGVLAFVKAVLVPVQQLREEQARGRGEPRAARGDGTGSFVKPDAPDGTIFSIGRPEKFGGDIHFSSYQQLEDAYAKEEIHPGDLKSGVTDALVLLLEPIRKMFDADPEWQEAESKGYPNQSVGAAHGAAHGAKPTGAKAEAKKGEPKVVSAIITA